MLGHGRAHLEHASRLPPPRHPPLARRRRRALVVHVVDLFDWPGSLLPDLPGLLRLDRADVDLVVAINKCDLLPKRAPRERIEAWARAGLRAAGLSNDRIASLALVSARTGEGIDALLGAVKQHRKGRDVYVVGSVNAGKSSLVNRMLHSLWVAPAAKTPPGRRAMRGGGVVIDADDLPPGLAVGDVISGDVGQLIAAAKAANRASEGADAGMPVPRFAVADAAGRTAGGDSSGLASELARQGGSAAARAELARVAALEAAATTVSVSAGGSGAATSLTRRGGSSGARALTASSDDAPPDILAGAAALADGRIALPPQLRPRSDADGPSGGVGGLARAADALERSAPAHGGQPGGDGAAAVSHAWLAGVPLTTSPVPGTTLGVIGAPLGPSHGGGMLFDTPGLAGKDGKRWQELVERVVSQAAEHTQVSAWLKALAAERRASGVPHGAEQARPENEAAASAGAGGASGAAPPAPEGLQAPEAGRGAGDEARPAAMPLWSSLPPGVVPPADCSADPVAGAPPSRVLAARTPVKAARCLMPVRPLRARHVRLVPGSSLLLGGLGRLDYEHLAGDGVHMLATAWTGLDVRTVPRWRADELLDRHAWQGGQIWPVAGQMAEPSEGAWLYDAASEEERWLAEEGRAIWGSEMRLGAGPTAVAAAAASAAERRAHGSRGALGAAGVGGDDDEEWGGGDAGAAGRGLGGAVGGSKNGRSDDRRRQRRSRQEGRAPAWRPAAHGESPGAAGFRMVDWAEGVDADWHAPPRGGNPGRTRYRRQERFRRAIVDVVFGGMGWLALTPIEVEGMYGWERAVKGARFLARAVPGAAVSLRQPLLPFEASGTRTRDWQ